ncbi:MAG: sulfite exporter TauE/SafE family protein [Bacteroidota bacterium]
MFALENMEAVEIIGYILAFGVGSIMGLFGAGGSLIFILMIYFFGLEVTTATGYALFLIGLTASFGVADKWRKREVDVATALVFAVPVIAGTLFARMYLIHWIPDVLMEIGEFELTKKNTVLLLFAALLLLSFSSMVGLWGKNLRPDLDLRTKQSGRYYSMVIVIGFFIGVLTSLVGAGGGVLIVPVLVILIGMEMKKAIGTSLTLAASKSLIGFIADAVNMGGEINWGFLFSIGAVMVLGILLGSYASNYLPANKLKRGFGWFILFLALLILVRETGLLPA